MSADPLVSFITPTYNHARFLGRCIDSIRAQSYANWELVVVDDGSTDDTADVVKRYDDPRIQYVWQPNQGVKRLASTINNGLARSRGALVTMLASDDYVPPDRLARQVPLFADPNVVLVFGKGAIVDVRGEPVGEATPPANLQRAENRPVGSALHDMLVSNFIPQYTVLLRRAALDRIGGYLQPEGLYAEDYPTHLRLALEGEFRYVPHVLGYYRMHPQQMTRTHYLRMVETDIPYVLRFFDELPPEARRASGWERPALERALARRLHNTYFEVGRRELLARQWKEARGHFGVAFRKGDARTKAKAAAGVACSLLRVDMERLARLTGRPPLR